MKERFAIPGVDAHTALSAAAPAVLLAKAEPLFTLEDAARSGADSDAVHDMRVASRRLREAMRLLAPLYPHSRFDPWYRRVRDITRALGPVRDADVFLEYFTHLAPELRPGGQRAISYLIGYRTGTREAELATLNRRLARLDLAGNAGSFAKLARTASRTGDATFGEFAHAAIAERAATVFGAQPDALVPENTAAQHALRIDYKRLRYAAEVFAPCYGAAFDDLHGALTAFQDALGDLHDAHVFLATVRDPALATRAEHAGLTTADLDEVAAVLDSRSHDAYLRFTTLATQHPAELLLPELLLPLATRPTATVAAAEVEVIDAETATISPVTVGDEPWAQGWEEDPLVDDSAPGAARLDALVSPE